MIKNNITDAIYSYFIYLKDFDKKTFKLELEKLEKYTIINFLTKNNFSQDNIHLISFNFEMSCNMLKSLYKEDFSDELLYLYSSYIVTNNLEEMFLERIKELKNFKIIDSPNNFHKFRIHNILCENNQSIDELIEEALNIITDELSLRYFNLIKNKLKK